MKTGYAPPGTNPLEGNVIGLRGGGFGDGWLSGAGKHFIFLGLIFACFAGSMFMWMRPDQPDPTPTPSPTWTPEPPPPAALVNAESTMTPNAEQLAATATAHVMYSQPAVVPQTAPSFIGVVTLEHGCVVSNIGFTTSGYNGKPYYLYLRQPLEQNPTLQLLHVAGIVQEFDECQYPVIMVQSASWFGESGTPSPLSYGGAVITSTVAPTVTVVNPHTWGLQATPVAPVQVGQVMATPIGATNYAATYAALEASPTVTPTATATPYIPPAPQARQVAAAIAEPTNTPETLSLFGEIVQVGGCGQTNLAVDLGSGDLVYIVLAGARLPDTDPIGLDALVTGQEADLCDGDGIRASQIIWYERTPTPTPSPTNTPTPTATNTPIPTATAAPAATLPPPTSTPVPTLRPSDDIETEGIEEPPMLEIPNVEGVE